ncbi:MAG: ParB/RepB/Spo0J family partition protein [Anaerolineaceae bacterium]
MPVRQISEADKQIVKKNQKDTDGVLRCFITGEIINENDEIEYDHVTAYSYDGPSDTVNVKVVLKGYNRRKKDQTLFDVRDQINIQRLYEQKQNNVKLQDILEYKQIQTKNISAKIENYAITLSDATDNHQYSLLHDNILKVNYFYARLPIKWVQNDDQEGLQPRVIDQKRLFDLSKHLKQHPQLAPAIARLVDGKIYLFDGQHKTAAQILNDVKDIDCKVFISPNNPPDDRKLFDQLMITNLDAHSKLRQVPFYNSTLIERFSVIYKEIWEDFAAVEPQENHSEENFSQYLIKRANFERKQANEIMRSMIIEANLSSSSLKPYIAEASKDVNYPTSVEVVRSHILPNCVFLSPSKALFDSVKDFRNHEVDNFSKFSKILMEKSCIGSWVPFKRNAPSSQIQLKARRIWHKGSVMTWGPMIQDIIINACNMKTADEREKLLYRQALTHDQVERAETCLDRLFNHTLWVDPNPEIDKLLASATKQEELFTRSSLTASYVLTGTV